MSITKLVVGTMLFVAAVLAIAYPVDAQPILIGRRCCTNSGGCTLPRYQPINSSCGCVELWGIEQGTVCQ